MTSRPAGACAFCALPPEEVVAQNDQAVAFRDRYPIAGGTPWWFRAGM